MLTKICPFIWNSSFHEASKTHLACRNGPYGQVLVLPSRRLVRPAADDDFVACRNAPYGKVLVLSRQRLECPAADDNFTSLFELLQSTKAAEREREREKGRVRGQDEGTLHE